MKDIKALAFDTGGTVLDWHRGISSAMAAVGQRRGIEADWSTLTNEYRRDSLAAIVNQLAPRFNFDDVHRDQLDRVLDRHGINGLSKEDRDEIWRAWFHLDAWPDFVPGLTRLRKIAPCVSFTLLTPRLVIDVSRRNGILQLRDAGRLQDAAAGLPGGGQADAARSASNPDGGLSQFRS